MVEAWAQVELAKLLGFAQTEAIVQQMMHLSTQGRDAVVEYAHDLLGEHDPLVERFLEDFCKRMKLKSLDTIASDLTKLKGRSLTIRVEKSKKKEKAIVLESTKRSVCGCLGTTHRAVVNCLCCGRVLCASEGVGECFFCGSKVNEIGTVSNAEFISQFKEIAHRVNAKSKRNESASLVGIGCPDEEGLEKALAHRDKLLEYAEQKIARSRILDDQEDFFDMESNIWLDENEAAMAEEIAAEKERELELQIRPSARPVVLDIDVGKNSVTQSVLKDGDLDSRLAELKMVSAAQAHRVVTSGGLSGPNHLEGRALDVYSKLKERISGMTTGRAKVPSRPIEPKFSQSEARCSAKFDPDSDFEIDESAGKTDRGDCLSLHQPWASLVVHGIKRFEGRTWSSLHRGPLWIASTARVPDPQEIAAVEEQYVSDYGLSRESIPFPQSYPVGALLGRVDMVNCLSNSDFQTYREKMMKEGRLVEQNGSDFVFVCRRPQALAVALKIIGKHKIWRLPKEVRESACHALELVDHSWRHSNRAAAK
jgi:hypothetical protein